MIDLHAHLPMQFGTRVGGGLHGGALRSVLGIANRLRNYGRHPRCTIDGAIEGGLTGFVSVAYDPFSEIDPRALRDAAPRDSYNETLLRQMDAVERAVEERWPEAARFVRTPAELDEALERGWLFIAHAVEGGFFFGSTPDAVTRNVAILAERGIVYATLAHIFYRGIATNVATAELMPDRAYHHVFAQPSVGLTDLGRAALAALFENGVLVDMKHMSNMAMRDTLALYDEWDPKREVPVAATHMACRLNDHESTIDDAILQAIAERDGVAGITLSVDVLRPAGGRPPRDGIELVLEHIDHVRGVTGSNRHAAIGSDYDGFVRPPEGLGSYRDWPDLRRALVERFGAEDADAIASGNVLRVLRGSWRRRRTIGGAVEGGAAAGAG